LSGEDARRAYLWTLVKSTGQIYWSDPKKTNQKPVIELITCLIHEHDIRSDAPACEHILAIVCAELGVQAPDL
jgi:hypothetical protein